MLAMGLVTCMLLIGCTYASSLGTSAFELREQFEKMTMNMQEKPMSETPDYKTAPLYLPPRCRKLACPPARVVASRGSYEKVCFSPAVYAKVRVEGRHMMPAFFEAYDRLHKYYDGANADNIKLPMTAPVIFRVDPGAPDGMFNPRNFTLFFYMDPKVKSPPVPDAEDITVLEVNSYSLYIRTFSSYTVVYGDWMRELLQLANDVEADMEPFRREFYYFASYDSPFEMTRRINEAQLLVPSGSSGL